MHRSTAYWAANPYRRPEPEPGPTAPYRDLPAGTAGRFRRVRTAVLQLPGVAEQVRFMGTPWGWAWEYTVAQRKLCWLHPVAAGSSVTFTLSGDEEAKALAIPRLAAPVRHAILQGQRTGPVKWCWLPLADQRHVDAFLRFVRRKAEWLSAPGGRRRMRV